MSQLVVRSLSPGLSRAVAIQHSIDLHFARFFLSSHLYKSLVPENEIRRSSMDLFYDLINYEFDQSKTIETVSAKENLNGSKFHPFEIGSKREDDL